MPEKPGNCLTFSVAVVEFSKLKNVIISIQDKLSDKCSL